MIIKLKKMLFYGLKNELESFFAAAQKEGIIEFIGSFSKKVKKMPPELKNFVKAIKILKKQPVIETYKKKTLKNLEQTVFEIVNLQSDIDILNEKKAALLDEINLVSPFGPFLSSDINIIKNETNYNFYFYTRKTNKKNIKKKEIPQELIYISTEYDLDYFVHISLEKKEFKGFFEINIESPVNDLRKSVKDIENKIAEFNKTIKELAIFLPAIKDEFNNKLNEFNLEKAKKESRILLEDTMFSIEGWVPENKIEDLSAIVKNYNIDFSEIQIEKDEVMPTYIENDKIGKLGEDLVNIYDTPSTEDKDPSLWVLFFFAIFFAIITSDAGYGFIFLALGFIMKYKIKKPTAAVKRFNNLIFMLSATCILWGGLSTSFFGISFSPTSKMQRISLINYLSEKKANYHLINKDDVYKEWLKKYPAIAKAKNGEDFLVLASKDHKYEAMEIFNRNILMELSILIGVIHISTAFLRNIKKHYAGIGWVLFIIGGYLFFPSILNAASIVNYFNILPKENIYEIGKISLYSGIAVAVILAFIQDRLKGIREITNIIGIFGDVLSYLRLYALALAGMILSQTFNDIALSMPIFFGVFVIIIGHSINIALILLGGIIHGLRLNFLEWYNHCFEGGGKAFTPLKIIKKL